MSDLMSELQFFSFILLTIQVGYGKISVNGSPQMRSNVDREEIGLG